MTERLTLLEDFTHGMMGLTAWGVEQGYGSFLRFEFGEPKLVIEERSNRQKRSAYVHGAWHLWIYCCHWQIFDKDEPIAWSEDERPRIHSATGRLNGQNLTMIEVEAGRSSFRFDLGGMLETWPYDDGIDDQWLIFHGDEVFTYRGDGAYSRHSCGTLPDDVIWSFPTPSRPHRP